MDLLLLYFLTKSVEIDSNIYPLKYKIANNIKTMKFVLGTIHPLFCTYKLNKKFKINL